MPRGDHIVPSFEEIWPSKAPAQRVKRGIEYYLDVSMEWNFIENLAPTYYKTNLFKDIKLISSHLPCKHINRKKLL